MRDATLRVRECEVRECGTVGLGSRSRGGLVARIAAAAVALSGCQGYQHALDPRGPAAARIADLWWIMFGLATVISVITIALLLFAVVRGRQRRRGREVRPVNGSVLVWGGGVIVPLVVVFYLVVVTVRTGTAVHFPSDIDENHLTVDVIAHKFWWEVRYPQQGITTANEIYIPAGEAVRVRVSTPDVIHSFWVPQLHGKIDMIPGRINQIWLRADEPGLFRGQCAEYCGPGHALMAFWVEAMPPEQFAAWVDARLAPAAEPAIAEVQYGREVFFQARCHECHATRGVPLPPEVGEPGPDLTDFGRRRTIAAGTLTNNRGNLGGWIADPQHIKPGNRMPPTWLEGPDLQALLTYLHSLR